MYLRAERPVGHATGLVFLRGLVEHAHAAARIALLRAHDRANVVAELLVLRETGRSAREDAIGHVGLTAEEREVGVILRGAGRALTREAVAIGDLTSLHARPREAETRVPPHRRAVRPEAGLRLGELVDRLIHATRRPIHEPRR